MRGPAVLLVVALVGTACADRTPGGNEGGDPVVQAAEAPPRGGPSALDDPASPGFPDPLIDLDDLRAGGPPPDGIPPIDDPAFLRVDEVDFLDDREPVIAVEVGGEVRAYPVQIMTWHEIVNDTVGGVPVTVTYCPLCNSAIVFDRRIDGDVLSFGTSGLLYQSALVMYDRQTESLWSHFTGEAVVGQLTGTDLEVHPSAMVSWRDWRQANPSGLVLSRDTGHSRSYGVNPYPGYDDLDEPPFLFEGEVDGRLAAKERVVGVGRDDEPVAIRLDALLTDRVVPFAVAGEPAVAWLVPDTASALDEASIAAGRDVGTTGVFHSEVEGRILTFEADGREFVDRETGSRWNVLGAAVAGPLAGRRLEPVEHVDTFWFAWAAFVPETEIAP